MQSLLAHHGSELSKRLGLELKTSYVTSTSMPKRFFSSAWDVGPPPWTTVHKAKAKYSTWDQNTTKQYVRPWQQKPKGAYAMCHDTACSGWSYLDGNDTKCRVCGTTTGHWKTGSGLPTIDAALFSSLGAEDPVRKTMQQFLDAGTAVLLKPPVVDSYAELHSKVRACTDALVRSENQLNNQRNNLRQCREKLQKWEDMVCASEKEVAENRKRCNSTREQYEKLVGEHNLRSHWATATASSPPEGTAAGVGADTEKRLVVQLEAELRAMREAFQQLSEAHRVATAGGAAGVVTGSTAGLSPAPAEAAAGAVRAAAGDSRGPAVAMALEDDPDHKRVKRLCQRAAMEDEDKIEHFDETMGAPPLGLPLTQGATPQQVIDAANKAALSAKVALEEQRG